MKVVICGAGIAGLALARQLSQRGADVLALEKAPGPRTQGYMIDFFGTGYDAAEAMGVLPRIRDVGYQVDELVYVDERGRRRASMAFAQFGKAVGGRFTSIMRPDLERVLREALPESVDLRYGTSLTGIEQHTGGVRLGLTDGTTVDADLLVGADGVHSFVRSSVFGPESDHLRYLGFHTAAYLIDDPEIHARTAGRFTLTDTVDRQIGGYGLRDGRVALFGVHRTPDPTLPADPRVAVREAYGSLGWLVPQALRQCPPPAEVYYDQVAQIVMPSWSQGRVVLIGDACHAVSLLAGQGASLGIAGAYLLAEQLARAGSVDLALHRYENLWRPVVEEKQQVARSGAEWFLPASGTRLRIRRAALALAKFPGFDRFAATALTGKSSGLIRALDDAGQSPDVVSGSRLPGTTTTTGL